MERGRIKFEFYDLDDFSLKLKDFQTTINHLPWFEGQLPKLNKFYSENRKVKCLDCGDVMVEKYMITHRQSHNGFLEKCELCGKVARADSLRNKMNINSKLHQAALAKANITPPTPDKITN